MNWIVNADLPTPLFCPVRQKKKTVQVSPKMNGVGKAPVVRSLPAPGRPGACPRRTDFSHNQILTTAPNDDELVFAQELGKG